MERRGKYFRGRKWSPSYRTFEKAPGAQPDGSSVQGCSKILTESAEKAKDEEPNPNSIAIGKDRTIKLPDYFVVRDNFLTPWLQDIPRSDVFDEPTLCKPYSGDWAEVRPKPCYVRMKPSTQRNMVLTMATFKHFLLVGMGLGDVLLFDMNSMILIRTYEVHEVFGVRQIIVGQKPNRFFTCAYDEFSEYSYYQETPILKFRNQCFIQAVLCSSYPMLIVDIDGFVSIYREHYPDIKVYPLGKLFDSVSYIEELKAYIGSSSEYFRPVILRHRCCVALANLTIAEDQKLTVWKKDLLSLDPEEKFIITCFEEKVFYASVPNFAISKFSNIYVSQIKEIGLMNRSEIIKTSTGVVLTMKAFENYLTVVTRSPFIEIFDARTNVNSFVINTGHLNYYTIVLKNLLLVGTQEGSLIIQELPYCCNEICLHCQDDFKLVNEGVIKRCSHFVVPEKKSLFPFK